VFDCGKDVEVGKGDNDEKGIRSSLWARRLQVWQRGDVRPAWRV